MKKTTMINVEVETSTEKEVLNIDAAQHSAHISQKKRRPKKTKRSSKQDEDERHLESLVFGLESEVVSELQKPTTASDDVPAADDALFQLDRQGDTGDNGNTAVELSNVEQERRPAWEDEDDDEITLGDVADTFAGEKRLPVYGAGASYRSTLVKKFSATVGQPDWADPNRKRRHSSDSEDEDAQSLLTKTGHLLSTDAPTRLAKGTIVTKRCGKLTTGEARRRPVTVAEFHHKSQVALVGGGGQPSLAIVQVDGRDNPLVQQIPLQAGFRVKCGHFSADGEHILASSEFAGHLLTYDMMSGKLERVEAPRRQGLRSVPYFLTSPDGRWLAVPGARAGAVHLLAARSREWVDTLQASGRVTAVAFSPDGTRLWSHTDEGCVYEWDVAARRCVHRFTDEGCLRGTALAVSPDGRLLACGSQCGVVNLYETSAARQRENPTPLRVLDQLTTECDRLRFNGSSEMLAMASSQKEHALRLVHLRSLTVFSNFPGWSQAVKEPHSVDFSPQSGYLTIGNSKGKALLYRLQHYHNY